MIFNVIQKLKSSGILGINMRNAEYIMGNNPRSSFPIVDNKILTKKLAAEYQIPTPILYHVIDHHGGIAGFMDVVGKKRQFVVKPARGAGGNGIILITDYKDGKIVTQSGRQMKYEELAYHISGILSGIFSLEGLEDSAIIESLVHPSPVFENVTFQGVPDIRIIVYRGVPVMAMVRLPTCASDGKANLHRGAIGVGVDMKYGTTMTAVHNSRIITHHPDTSNPVNGIVIPYWEKMLDIAARSYDMTGLGYLGVDLVIDKDIGPVLLEMNARPGLAIQMANRSGLLKRLKLIEIASSEIFASLETRIDWAKETFCTL